MQIYAGIDEAGYGPFFGPLVVARTVWSTPGSYPTPTHRPCEASAEQGSYPTRGDRPREALRSLGEVGAKQGSAPNPGQRPSEASPPSEEQGAKRPTTTAKVPDLWQQLQAGVTRDLRDPLGRIAIDDSKKVHSGKNGRRHLERGVLAIAHAAGRAIHRLDDWLALQPQPQNIPAWYHPDPLPDRPDRPDQIPAWLTPGETEIAAALLTRCLREQNTHVADLAVDLLFEDRFNQLAQLSNNKSALTTMMVARHLMTIWRQYGTGEPRVVVDRQGGRTCYRQLLQDAVPEARIQVITQTPARSIYHLEHADHNRQNPAGRRAMWVAFEVDADNRHLPVAAASMAAKYTRELLMERMADWFTQRIPNLKPTAGYGSDAKRFWLDIQPHLKKLNINPDHLRRMR